MEWISNNWWWIIIALVALSSVALFAFRKWRDTREAGEANKQIFDLVETVLDTLNDIFRNEAHKVDEAQVINAARDVYQRFIATTSLSMFISQDEFTRIVLGAWQELVGVKWVVAHAVAQAIPTNVGVEPRRFG